MVQLICLGLKQVLLPVHHPLNLLLNFLRHQKLRPEWVVLQKFSSETRKFSHYLQKFRLRLLVLVVYFLLVFLLLVIKLLESFILLDCQSQFFFVFGDDPSLAWDRSEMDRLVLNSTHHVEQLFGSIEIDSVRWGWSVMLRFIFHLVVDILIEHVVFILNYIHIFKIFSSFNEYLLSLTFSCVFPIAVIYIWRTFHGCTTLRRIFELFLKQRQEVTEIISLLLSALDHLLFARNNHFLTNGLSGILGIHCCSITRFWVSRGSSWSRPFLPH